MAGTKDDAVRANDGNQGLNPDPATKRSLSDVRFAFGPGTRFWVIVDGEWKLTRASWLNWRSDGIDDPCWVTFRHDDGYFVGGVTKGGEPRMFHAWKDPDAVPVADIDSFVANREAYMRLQNWLLKVIKDDPSRFEEVALTIGPQGSYFARYKTSHLTHALPKDLRIAIADASAAPQNIALGVRGAWCATWSDGTLKSNLCNAYPTLEKSNAFANDTKAPVFVALNPFVEDQYFVVGLDGSCSYKHQLDREDSQYVHDKTDTYMRMRARRDGTTFDHFTHLEGRADRKICITPVSNVVETRIDNYKAILRAQEDPIDRRTLIGIGAIAGGSVVLARAARIPIKRTAAPLVAMGFGAAVSSWYHGAF